METFSRLSLLIGKEVLEKLQKKAILIIGLGGVGGYALEALMRCGIQNFILVDYDAFSLTNLNRQLMATYETIGHKKIDIYEKRIHSVVKNANVIKIDTKITKENIDILFQYPFDYIIDAEDDIEVKKELIRKKIQYKSKILFVMGTGNKMDPSKLKITDIRKTSYDPIAKAIRKMVKEEKIKEKITVLSSIEPKYTKSTKEIPSNSFVPATAGLLAASYIVNDVVKNERITKNNK